MGTRLPEAGGVGECDPSGLSYGFASLQPWLLDLVLQNNLRLGQRWLELGNTTLRPQCPFPGRFKDISTGFGAQPFGKRKRKWVGGE